MADSKSYFKLFTDTCFCKIVLFYTYVLYSGWTQLKFLIKLIKISRILI